MTRFRTYAAAALLLAATLGAAACGGDDDSDDSSSDTTAADDNSTDDTASDSGDSHDRGDYVAILSAAGSGFSADEAQCAAEVFVDVVGVDQLEAVGAYEKIQQNPDGNFSDYGISTLDEAQGAELYSGLNSCKDMRAFFKEQMAADGSIPPEGAACVVDAIDEATFSQMIVASFLQGEAAIDDDPAMQGVFAQAATDCMAAGVDLGTG